MLYEVERPFAEERHSPDLSLHAVNGAIETASRRPRRLHDEAAAADSLLLRYIAGWSEANPAKICAAAADDYRFDDPLVGTFSKQSLPHYFELLRTRFAVTGAVRPTDLSFSIRGLMGAAARRPDMQYWREAPRIGLTGVTQITVSKRGVVAEAVAYDLNMASDLLRGGRG